MADGTVSIADGLGLKALDSNELRRRQQISEFSHSSQSRPNLTEVGHTNMRGNSGDSRSRINLGNTVHASYSDGSRVSSPKTSKQSSPSRKLQQVFEEALAREAGERASELLAGKTKNGSISDHTISQDSDGSGALSPKSQINPNPKDAQKFQQQQVTHLHGNTYQFQRTPAEVQDKQGMRSESEARMLEIVSRLEDELNLSEDPFVLDVVTAKLQSIQ
ncbi:hypothetical protein RHGRI_014310 [Rhododendron griersonianum]|uniref:Uncharacterized protein n=1 Tax=Rhododendron griersonianum TaxID=479676 RepID=A0AAV6K953_9ERIC|nr:hypothetical protein RHGRI_014310 [Rhododendron griersonianum]